MAKQAFIDGATAIDGLAALNRGLKKMDAGLPSAVKAEFKEVATHTASVIAGKIPRRTGKMAASVKPRSSANYAGIAAYGAKVPYGRWMDFGGGREKGRGVRPGGNRRDFIAVGRYVYPTLHDLREETMQAAEDAIEKVLRMVE